jgi:uncharacterized protein YgiM (DUF1202 family)
MRKSISILALMFMLLTVDLAIAQVVSAQSPSATVNTGALNIRTGSSVNHPVITFVYHNTVLTLLARNADISWVKVMTTTGVQGWVNARYLLTGYALSNLPIEEMATGITASVRSYALNVRTGPGPDYSRLITVANGTFFDLLARNAEATWVKVALPSGLQGWVNVFYVSPSHSISTLPIEVGVPPATSENRTHTVQSGENLFRIALRYGVDMYDVARLNGITNLTLIYVGQVLLLP